jgi:hypothetical protein
LKARKLERSAAELTMNRAAVARHQEIALRRRGCEVLQRFPLEPSILQRRHDGTGAHGGVAMAGLAGRGQGVVAGVDAVPAQCPLTDRRGPTADAADEVLHAIIGYGLPGQEGAGPGNEGIAQSPHGAGLSERGAEGKRRPAVISEY